MSTRFAYRLSLAFLILLTTGPMARAVNWDGTIDTDWFTAGNWVSPAAVPGLTSDVNIGTTPNNPLISGGPAVAGFVDVGWSGGSGVLNITDNLTTGGTDDIVVQETTAGTNTGTVNHTAGTVDTDSVHIGRSAAGFGLYTLNGGTLTLGNTTSSDIEIEHNGTFDFISGSVSGVSDLQVGNTTAGSAVVNLHGNTLSVNDDVQLSYVIGGRTGTDALNLQGGTLNVGSAAGDDFLIGGSDGAGTTFTIGAGETVNVADNFSIGYSGGGSKATVNVDAGGTLKIDGDWLIATDATDTARDVVNINAASGISMTGATGTTGDFTIEGNGTVNMNATDAPLAIFGDLRIGSQLEGVSIFNMAAGSTVSTGLTLNMGSNLLGETEVDQLNMGAGSTLNVGTTANIYGWDGGGTVTLADGTVNVGTSMAVGSATLTGLGVTLNMTGADLDVGTSFTLASGLQAGDTTIDHFNQSAGQFDTGTTFTITYEGRADISGDALFNVGTGSGGDLNIGSGADPGAEARFTARGNSTVNVADDLNLASGVSHGGSTFTIQDNAVVNVGLAASDDFNITYRGTVDIEGGQLNIFDDFNIGVTHNAAVTEQRTVNQSGGAVVVGSFLDLGVGNGAIDAVYNMTGGTLQVGTLATDELDLTSTSTGTVEFNLDGGILSAKRIDDGTGNGVFNYGAGTLSPGFEGTADLTAFIGDLTMSSDSKLTMDIQTADIAGLPNDLLTVSGDLFFDGEIKINHLDGEFSGTPGRYIIATYGGTLTVGTPELVGTGPDSMFDYLTPGEIAVLFSPPAIPEPSTMTLLGLGLFGLVRLSRRRRK